MVSGGYRPGASQNNPNKISLTGGNGQSGRQAAQYIPGMASSGVTGKEVYESQTAPGTKLQGDPTASLRTSQVIGLDEPTMFADEPGTAGIDRGPGINSSAFRADLPNSKPSMTATLQKLAVFDDSGEIEMLLQNKMQIG
jgi:hypothetical protein